MQWYFRSNASNHMLIDEKITKTDQYQCYHKHSDIAIFRIQQSWKSSFSFTQTRLHFLNKSR